MKTEIRQKKYQNPPTTMIWTHKIHIAYKFVWSIQLLYIPKVSGQNVLVFRRKKMAKTTIGVTKINE